MKFSKIKISFYFFFLISCAVAKDKDMYYDKIITLPNKKLIELKEIGIKFELQECGRQSMFENGHQVREQPYCLIHIQTEKDTLYLTNNKKDIFVKKYSIQLEDINPWGSEERGLPGYSVKIKITTAPSVVFVENFGWTVDYILSTDSLGIPQSLTALPFAHYESAAASIGFGLDSLKGQTVQLQKMIVKEKGKRSSKSVHASVILINEKAYTGWLFAHPESGIAPGISPLTMKKSELVNW